MARIGAGAAPSREWASRGGRRANRTSRALRGAQQKECSRAPQRSRGKGVRRGYLLPFQTPAPDPLCSKPRVRRGPGGIWIGFGYRRVRTRCVDRACGGLSRGSGSPSACRQPLAPRFIGVGEARAGRIERRGGAERVQLQIERKGRARRRTSRPNYCRSGSEVRHFVGTTPRLARTFGQDAVQSLLQRLSSKQGSP